MSAALSAANFYLQQQQLLNEEREAQLTQKLEKMQAACRAKLKARWACPTSAHASSAQGALCARCNHILVSPAPETCRSLSPCGTFTPLYQCNSPRWDCCSQEVHDGYTQVRLRTTLLSWL